MVGLRAEKTTKNQDDFKVLLVGIMFSIFLMVGSSTVLKVWDRVFSERPFITATIKIIAPRVAGGDPTILYDADPKQNVDGFWIASIVDLDDVQLATRTGEGHYTVKNDNPRVWTWFAFFDNEKGLNSPGHPTIPFKVCVRYVVNARDSGNNDESPDFCSEFYNPRG